jgi:Fur family transcriptional regulator, ferric uptake regulator
MSKELENRTSARLRAAGQRLTSNRRAVIEVLTAAGQPLTIPEVLTARRGLAQSSAYRTLTVLEQAGVVRRVPTEGDFARYELAEDLTEHHHHLMCASCGAVEDVVVPARLERSVDDAVAAMAEANRYEVRSHRLDIVGLCPRCA